MISSPWRSHFCSAVYNVVQYYEATAARSCSSSATAQGGAGGSGGADGGNAEVSLSISRLVSQQALRGDSSNAAIKAADVQAMSSVPDEATWDAIKAAFVAQSQHLEKATGGKRNAGAVGGGGARFFVYCAARQPPPLPARQKTACSRRSWRRPRTRRRRWPQPCRPAREAGEGRRPPGESLRRR